jgi:hypothetical protein
MHVVKEEYCWATTQTERQSCYVLVFVFQLNSLEYRLCTESITCLLSFDLRKIRFAPDLPRRNYCIVCGGSVSETAS